MHKYIIKDVYMALGLSFGNFFKWLFFILFILFFLYQFLVVEQFFKMNDFIKYLVTFLISMIPISFIQSIFIYFANRRYIIDLESGLITFPRTDMENSILEIILFYPYWNLMRTKTIHASEIENLYLDTQRSTTSSTVSNGRTAKGKEKFKSVTNKHVKYTINIVGTFGSANLEFLSRQKRDEVRNAIQQCVKQYTDKNIDFKVAEFN